MYFKLLYNVVFHKTEENDLSVPKFTDCIRIDDKLHVRLFYNRYPVPLPSWLRDKS